MRCEPLGYFITPLNLVGFVYIIRCFERPGSWSLFNSGHKVLNEINCVFNKNQSGGCL